jgi:hypothetical protein
MNEVPICPNCGKYWEVIGHSTAGPIYSHNCTSPISASALPLVSFPGPFTVVLNESSPLASPHVAYGDQVVRDLISKNRELAEENAELRTENAQLRQELADARGES